MSESFSQPFRPQAPEAGFHAGSPEYIEPVFDAEFIYSSFGLEPEEALQVITYGDKGTSPLWMVLTDSECPVGGMIKTARDEAMMQEAHRAGSTAESIERVGRQVSVNKVGAFNEFLPKDSKIVLGDEAKKKFLTSTEQSQSNPRQSDQPKKLGRFVMKNKP